MAATMDSRTVASDTSPDRQAERLHADVVHGPDSDAQSESAAAQPDETDAPLAAVTRPARSSAA